MTIIGAKDRSKLHEAPLLHVVLHKAAPGWMLPDGIPKRRHGRIVDLL
jgi:hypothetical protein